MLTIYKLKVIYQNYYIKSLFQIARIAREEVLHFSDYSFNRDVLP